LITVLRGHSNLSEKNWKSGVSVQRKDEKLPEKMMILLEKNIFQKNFNG